MPTKCPTARPAGRREATESPGKPCKSVLGRFVLETCATETRGPAWPRRAARRGFFGKPGAPGAPAAARRGFFGKPGAPGGPGGCPPGILSRVAPRKTRRGFCPAWPRRLPAGDSVPRGATENLGDRWLARFMLATCSGKPGAPAGIPPGILSRAGATENRGNGSWHGLCWHARPGNQGPRRASRRGFRRMKTPTHQRS